MSNVLLELGTSQEQYDVQFERMTNDPELATFASGTEALAMSDDDRLLTEVDHLIRGYQSDQQFDPAVDRDVLQNLFTAVQEQAMPYAITETEHEAVHDPERRQRIFMWMGKTAIENASSGYNYHRHESALARVDVEVDEAEHAATMIEGRARVFISPRMSSTDADLQTARSEHLGDDDSVRVSWLEVRNGKTVRVMQSVLVRDIPLDAWVALLQDSENPFGKTIAIENADSALSVMKVHRELELPREQLQNGPISIIEAVVPYIQDPQTRSKVVAQLRKFSLQDQDEATKHAKLKAKEWLDFEKELAKSLVDSVATAAVTKFIADMHPVWDDSDRSTVSEHFDGKQYRVTRKLAAVLESAQQRFIAGRTAVLFNKEHVLRQVQSQREYDRIRDNELLIIAAQQSNMQYQTLLMQQNNKIARHEVTGGGGGCPGKNRTTFRRDKSGVEQLLSPFEVGVEVEDELSNEDYDDLGDRNFYCTKGHKNYRRKRNVPEPTCTECHEDVSCREPEIDAEAKAEVERLKVANSIFELLMGKIENEQFAAAA